MVDRFPCGENVAANAQGPSRTARGQHNVRRPKSRWSGLCGTARPAFFRYGSALDVAPSRRSLLLILIACALAAAGCSSGRREVPSPAAPSAWPPPVVESGQPIELTPGEAFHFVDHFHGNDTHAALPRGGDGHRRIALGDVRQPAICTPAPYTLRQKVRLPKGAVLRAAFGLAPDSWDKKGGGVRFCVRLRRGDETIELLSTELKCWRAADDPNWSPVTIDLLSGSGEEVEIELVTEAVGAPRAGAQEEFAAAYALWANPTILAPTREPRPNIVLVFVDALRADHLGCYGYERKTSPFLDRLAQASVLFEDVTSQATWTLPSTLSLLTSSYRFIAGLQIAGPVRGPAETGGEGYYVPPVVLPVSLQGELRKSGYKTLACVGGGFMNPALGWDSGFDWYWSPQHTPLLADQLAVLKHRLAADPRTPFFLFLHTYEVHNYFQGRAHCLEQFDSGYLGPLTDPRRLMDAALHEKPENLSPADLQYIRDLYDGEIRQTDRYLRLFLEWLLEQPWGKDTVVVLTADHGESLGDHGAMSHGGVPYQGVARVPLLLHLPHGRWSGRRVTQPAALVDLMPTLLGLAGGAAPPGMVGRSLIPLLQGTGRSDSAPILCESRGAALLAREGRWCYMSWRGEQGEELYDIARDPEQTHNLVGSAPERLHHMRRVLAVLAMRAARGFRLVVDGPRPDEVTVELTCDGPLSYLDAPTLQQADRLTVTKRRADDPSTQSRGHHARITLSPGEDPHVILFEPQDRNSAVLVSVASDGEPAETRRFRLGSEQRPAGKMPLSIGPEARPMLLADEPPVPGDLDTWGIWVWLPRAAAAAPPAGSPRAESLPSDIQDQLRSLGYLR